MSWLRAARGAWHRRMFHWLDQRAMPAGEHQLNLRNLYIFPTQRGAYLGLLVVVLWLIGTNYQNNLILALAFLLGSVFVVAILHTYANLAGLSIRFQGVAHVFAGEDAYFNFLLQNSKRRASDGLTLRWQHSTHEAVCTALAGGASATVAVPLASRRRGYLLPGRLCLESEFPLGLLRCWTWLNWQACAVVYPEPRHAPLPPSAVVDDAGEGAHPVRGGEDFSALNQYRPGDSLKHVAWKSYARGQGLFTKEFSQNVSREIWLDYHSLAQADIEARLSCLCYWALEYHRQDENYGLQLADTRIAPGKGENHRAQVLEALALFELGGEAR